jgi:excisionase family DNA binding protein
MTSESEYLTVEEIAAGLGVSKMTVYRMIHTGRLDAIRAGERVYRIHQAAYDAYLGKAVYVPANRKEAPRPGPSPRARRDASLAEDVKADRAHWDDKYAAAPEDGDGSSAG